MSSKSIVKVFNIVVEPTEEFIEYVYSQLEDEDIEIAASMSDIQRQNLIQQLLPAKEFSDFIEAVEKFLVEAVEKFLVADDCVIDRSVDSNRQNSLSHYISFHRKSDESPVDIKLVFHLRLSDHSLHDYRKYLQQKSFYKRKVTKDIEKQLSKPVSTSKYKSMLVGNKKVKDFSSLLSATIEDIHSWIER